MPSFMALFSWSIGLLVINIILHFNFHTTTLSHIFMSEFPLYTAQLPKKYFSKNRRFLGGIGVVYNHIHSIYYIFFERCAIRHIFLCGSVVVWEWKKKRPPRHHDEVVSGKIIMTNQLNQLVTICHRLISKFTLCYTVFWLWRTKVRVPWVSRR